MSSLTFTLWISCIARISDLHYQDPNHCITPQILIGDRGPVIAMTVLGLLRLCKSATYQIMVLLYMVLPI